MAKPKKGKQLSNGVAKKQPAGDGGEPSKIWNDERFAHLVNDPRFKGIPKTQKKVKIDKRFQSMFKDEKFNVKHTIDKYGRKVKQAESSELRKYYELGSSSEGEDGEGEKEEEEVDSDSDGLELDAEEKAMAMPDKVKSRLEDLEVDYARGEGAIASDSSSDDDSADEGEDDGEEVFIEHVWGELDADAERTDESTARLALCNLDWDRVRAVDIMVMLSSFLPRGSTILSVTIYPSEFGKERMKEEEEQGPQELTAPNAVESDEEDLDEEERKEKQLERLREYQLNRLKYFYAVVVCDNVETADKLYKECDGVEYESTANKLDLRFIPDDMEFDDEPKEKCTELPESGKYEPRVFITTALNQSKVELTWDENDVERKEFNEKIRAGKLTEVKDAELKKYVACSSSEEEGEEEAEEQESSAEEDDGQVGKGNKKSKKQDMIAKYKALLGEIKEQEEKEKDEKVEMEFTWKVNDEAQEDQESESDSEAKKKRDNVNPFEKILEKAKEKKKRRKELKKKKKRGELNGDGEADGDDSEDDLPYGVDLNDPFFVSAFDEKEFDLKKPTKDKKKKNQQQEEEDEEEAARKRAELELMLDDGEDDKSHFNLKAIQEHEIDLKSVSKSKRKRILKKSKRQIEEQRQQNAAAGADDFEIDVEDERFRAVYEKPEYNIDPTNPSFKKTKGVEKLIQEKLKKRPLKDNDLPNEEEVPREVKKPKKDVSTSLLVKSIKRKIGK